MDERLLIEKAQAGDKDAQDQLVLGNAGLVYKVASAYKGQLPMDDLVQEGMIGLMYAVDKYDLSQDVKFGTYAWYWIRKVIKQAVVTQGNMMPRSVMTDWEISTLKAAREDLTASLGRLPTDEELSAATGISASRVPNLLNRGNVSVISYDTKISDEDDATLLELLPAPAKENNGRMRKAVSYALSKLDPLEVEILSNVFGLNGKKVGTPTIAKSLGVSQQTVQNIKFDAIRKLRDPDTIDALKTILEGGEVDD